MTNPDHGPAVGKAVLRLVLLPIILLAEELIDTRRIAAGFTTIFTFACAYAMLTLFMALTGRRSRSQSRLEPILDLAFLCALDFASGGPFSQVRKAFFVLPLSAAVSGRARHTALWSALGVAGFLAVSLPHPDAREAGGGQFIVLEALYLAWTGVAATLLAWLLTIRSQRIIRLAQDRRRLLSQTLDSVENERKRIAYRLHDEAVQNVLVAKRELRGLKTEDARRRDDALTALDVTLRQLRETIFELQPLTLQQAGLAAAIRQLAEHHSRRTGVPIRVTLDPDVAGVHDQLIYCVTRELLTNAAVHAHAARIDVAVDRHDQQIRVEIADDGLGIDVGRPQQALREGHIGLAATIERVEALDGTLTIDTALGRGSIITAILPARRQENLQRRRPSLQPSQSSASDPRTPLALPPRSLRHQPAMAES